MCPLWCCVKVGSHTCTRPSSLALTLLSSTPVPTLTNALPHTLLHAPHLQLTSQHPNILSYPPIYIPTLQHTFLHLNTLTRPIAHFPSLLDSYLYTFNTSQYPFSPPNMHPYLTYQHNSLLLNPFLYTTIHPNTRAHTTVHAFTPIPSSLHLTIPLHHLLHTPADPTTHPLHLACQPCHLSLNFYLLYTTSHQPPSPPNIFKFLNTSLTSPSHHLLHPPSPHM